MKEKSILHMDLDTFFVSVERLMNSALNNLPKARSNDDALDNRLKIGPSGLRSSF